MQDPTFAQRCHRVFRDWLPSIVLLSLILVARSTLADHYHVPTGSMEHALQPGDHVVVNKAAYGLRIPFTKQVFAWAEPPERGEVVIFDSPEDGVRLIKRVVAVGGDEVTVQAGRVMINGRPLFDPQAPEYERYGDRTARLNLGRGGGPNLAPLTVPEGHVLVLGDYRGNSRDGRRFGTIPVEALYGRASGVFWRGASPLWQAL